MRKTIVPPVAIAYNPRSRTPLANAFANSGTQRVRRPFLPLLLLFAYLAAPGIGLAQMSFIEAGYFGDVEETLVWAYWLHATIVFGLTWWLCARNVRGAVLTAAVDLPKYSVERSGQLLLAALIILFAMGGARILFFGEDRGDLRISFGAAGFIYTWLQLYLTPFLIAVVAYLHSLRGRTVGRRALVVYAMGLFIGIMSGYKFTTVIIFMPALTIALPKLRVAHMAGLFAISICILLVTEHMQSDRQFDEAIAYLIARATEVSAYGPITTWSEFANDGVSIQRFLESSVLILGSKIGSLFLNFQENSVEYLRFNLGRYLTYLYYPNADAALSGAVNITLTVFGEAVAFFGGGLFWIWSILTGIFSGSVLRRYSRALQKGDIATAALWLVYFFSVLLSWINSSGWINLIALPIVVGMLALRLVARWLRILQINTSTDSMPAQRGVNA